MQSFRPDRMADELLLCLRCRASGHIFNDCNATSQEEGVDWMFSKARLAMNFDDAWQTSSHTVCERCQKLDLLSMLSCSPPWTTQAELSDAFKTGHPLVKTLGRTATLRLWSDCTACRCLFALIPQPSNGEQDVLLLPDWTLNRLAGEDGVSMDNDLKRQSATCLVVSLKPHGSDLPSSVIAHRGDALCLVDRFIGPRTLGGRKIDQGGLYEDVNSSPRVSQRFQIIQEWIKTCSEKHSEACAPYQTAELYQIRLLDVKNRVIVPYPGKGTQYVALSYVWGSVDQPSYESGSDLDGVTLPRTIEDAIWFTQHLGESYLWVDSLCINQRDETHKMSQIEMMSNVYRGSVVTLLALSSESAEGGIPRLSRNSNFSQATCCINVKRLVGLMPTLSQQIWVCSWGQRAWTLQEAMLSPKCLYFSDHQVHFECKAMQCCESLDETSSGSHQLTVSHAGSHPFVRWMAQQLGPGCLRVDCSPGRLDQYGRKITLYSFREMTDPCDGLNAFKGVLQKMKEDFYPQGWFEGLPVEDFDWALLWRHHRPAQRREGFPSWTWAGWRGKLWHGQPTDVMQPRRFPIHLDIQRAEGGRLVSVFNSEAAAVVTQAMAPDAGPRITIQHDAIDLAWSRPDEPRSNSVFDPAAFDLAEKSRYLFLDCIVLQRVPLDFSRPVQWSPAPGHQALFQVLIQDVKCGLRIMSLEREIVTAQSVPEGNDGNKSMRSFVLIARDHFQGYLVHHLMLVYQKPTQNAVARDDIWERATVLQLMVPLDRLDVLEEFGPRRQQMVLA
jgi:hypothetical protein